MFEDTIDRLPKRARIRLPTSNYAEIGTRVSVTVSVEGRRSVFVNSDLGGAVIDVLREQSERLRVGVLAYCLMPDHLHVLLQVDGDVDVVRLLQAFKGKTTNLSWGFGLKGQLWQRSFYDHVLRDTEDDSEMIRYILANPVRAGLVDTWNDYPFSGSFAYELSDGL